MVALDVADDRDEQEEEQQVQGDRDDEEDDELAVDERELVLEGDVVVFVLQHGDQLLVLDEDVRELQRTGEDLVEVACELRAVADDALAELLLDHVRLHALRVVAHELRGEHGVLDSDGHVVVQVDVEDDDDER